MPEQILINDVERNSMFYHYSRIGSADDLLWRDRREERGLNKKKTKIFSHFKINLRHLFVIGFLVLSLIPNGIGSHDNIVFFRIFLQLGS